MKSWFGSGGRTKSVGLIARRSSRMLVGQLLLGQAAGEDRRELGGGHPLVHSVRAAEKTAVTSSGRSRRSRDPLPRLRVLERLGEQVVEEQHLDAALAHQVDEGVVLLARAAHPDHVVEEQLVAVRRREALVGEVGPVDHHGPQRSDLRVGAEGGSVSVVMRSSFHKRRVARSSADGRRDADEGAEDDEDETRKGQTNFR